MSIEKLDYTEEATGRLLSTLQGGTSLEALAASYIDLCQELEVVGFDVLEQRGIFTAEGDRLDRIGSIVGIGRGGRTDEPYRLRIRAEIAILNSDGTAIDIMTVLGLLEGMTSNPFDIELDEAFPKALVLRPRDFNAGYTDADQDAVLASLKRAVSAGTDVDLVYPSSATDADTFHFSTVADTTQTSVTYGTETGALSGAAI